MNNNPTDKLDRKLGLFPVTNIVIANMIGAGIFTTSGLLMSDLNNPLIMLLLWIVGGWVSFIVGFSAPIAASSIGFSEYFARAFPQLFDWGNATGILNPVISKKILSISIITLFTFIHLRGIEFGAKVQNYLTILKVGLVVGLVALGFYQLVKFLQQLAGNRARPTGSDRAAVQINHPDHLRRRARQENLIRFI